MKVIGVKFKDGGKVYYFAPREDEIYEEGMQVVVETSKSVEFAYVEFLPKEVDDAEVIQPLKPIIRIATDRDREQVQKNIERKPQAMKIAQEKIEKHGLDMKLIDCEFSFDGNKVIFYFASDGRVDFRELVKDLAAAFHIRIELRQIGIRDETRLLGGIAPCGRECCCAGAMPDFCKVSIKMAKTQGLSLNPGKISGLCGRLMCCLSYENDYYCEAAKKMPKVGSEVDTPEGIGTVVTENMLKMTVRVKIEKDDGLIYRDFPVADITAHKKDPNAPKENKEPKEVNEAKEQKNSNAPQEQKNFNSSKNQKGQRESGEENIPEEQKGQKDFKNNRDFKGGKGQKDIKNSKGPKDFKGRKGHKGAREQGDFRERKGKEHFEKSEKQVKTDNSETVPSKNDEK